jgi:ligand-binding SRPBCC domain-containing protein
MNSPSLKRYSNSSVAPSAPPNGLHHMEFQHNFTVSAPVQSVVEFHRSATSLKSITPPFFFMSGLRAPARLSEGDAMSFSLWMGPIPIRWSARITRSGSWGFEDIQTAGPFMTWAHTHRFEALDENQTRVTDTIHFEYKRHWFWGPIGLVMAIGLPALFWYRAHRTKALLSRSR